MQIVCIVNNVRSASLVAQGPETGPFAIVVVHVKGFSTATPVGS